MSEGTIVDGRQGSGLVLGLKQNNNMHTTTYEQQQIIEQHAQELTPKEYSKCKHVLLKTPPHTSSMHRIMRCSSP